MVADHFKNKLKVIINLKIMPNLDQTGPQGQGAKTGRGLGHCKNDNAQTNENFPSSGRAQGQNRGQGQGLRQNQRNTPLRNQGRRSLSK